MDETPLHITTEDNDLGVHVITNLSPIVHTAKAVAKANSMLGGYKNIHMYGQRNISSPVPNTGQISHGICFPGMVPI